MALLQRFSFIMLLSLLVGCGGGGDGFNGGETITPDDTVDTIVISLTIIDKNVTQQSSTTITAKVMQGDQPLADRLVTFTVNDSQLGTFTPEIGTDSTDANGEATIVLNAGESAGSGEVTASVDSAEPATIVFDSQGVSDVVLRLGSGSPFVESTVQIDIQQISAGATSGISVAIVDEQNNLFTETVEVSFTSACTEEIIPSATLDSPVTTSNGIANSTYLAKGCVGDDPITVNAKIGGKSLLATGSINVLPADVGSIEFVASTPQNIGIIGTGAVGGSESSTIVFRVLDTNGNPVNNQDVDFELNTIAGGLNLIPVTATTNNEGLVQTVVNSGSVATTVRVQATVVDSSPSISSQSSVLVVSTGIPDQDSFTLSANILNPEAWSIDGNEVIVTARLADAFNNPVPNGTAVSFTTEGGSIEPSCLTSNGACSVTWKSQFPRPEGHIVGDINNVGHLPEVWNTMGQKLGGRATILATAIGEESFPDSNGNGRFDEAEMTAFLGTNISGLPYDLKEAFVDHNEDGLFNPSEAGGQTGGDLETPGSGDFNSNGIFDLNDGKYNGVLCSIPAHLGCSEQKSLNVRGQLTLVMSGSSANILTTFPTGGADIVIQGEGTGNGAVIISDLHNQPMPQGTIIEFIATVGSVVAGSPVTWANDNHNGGGSFGVTVKGEAEPKAGALIVTVTTPSGVQSSHTVAGIIIN